MPKKAVQNKSGAKKGRKSPPKAKKTPKSPAKPTKQLDSILGDYDPAKNPVNQAVIAGKRPPKTNEMNTVHPDDEPLKNGLVADGVDKKTANLISGLSLRERLFCREYVNRGVASQAWVAAGYRPGKYVSANANKLLRSPAIKAYVAELNRRRIARLDADADYILSELLRIHKVCATEKQAKQAGKSRKKADGDQSDQGADDPTHTELVDAGNSLKALDMIGKSLGIWKDEDTPTEIDIHITWGRAGAGIWQDADDQGDKPEGIGGQTRPETAIEAEYSDISGDCDQPDGCSDNDGSDDEGAQ